MHSDVLPWQCLSRYPEASRDVLFVDVDFPDLILGKRHVVRETPALSSPLGQIAMSDETPVVLRSRNYVQIACDLRKLDTLQEALSSVTDLNAITVLWIAEVSITYMETAAADAVIQWASGIAPGTVS